MLHLRRSTAAVLLAGAALVPALAATPVYAAGPSSAAVSTVAGWTYYATYPNQGSCLAAGPANRYGAPWECRPRPGGGYDLYVLL